MEFILKLWFFTFGLCYVQANCVNCQQSQMAFLNDRMNQMINALSSSPLFASFYNAKSAETPALPPPYAAYPEPNSYYEEYLPLPYPQTLPVPQPSPLSPKITFLTPQTCPKQIPPSSNLPFYQNVPTQCPPQNPPINVYPPQSPTYPPCQEHSYAPYQPQLVNQNYPMPTIQGPQLTNQCQQNYAAPPQPALPCQQNYAAPPLPALPCQQNYIAAPLPANQCQQNYAAAPALPCQQNYAAPQQPAVPCQQNYASYAYPQTAAYSGAPTQAYPPSPPASPTLYY